MPIVPYVVKSTGRSERVMDIYSQLLEERIIFVGSDIDDAVANTIIAQLIFLRAEDPKKEINIYINSHGGSIPAGLAICDTIGFIGVKVNTYCIGQAANVAALILSCGSKRYSLRNGRIMISQPYGCITGSSADLRIQAEEFLRMRESIAVEFARNTNRTLDQILEDFNRAKFMSASKAQSYGIIDEILHPTDVSSDVPSGVAQDSDG